MKDLVLEKSDYKILGGYFLISSILISYKFYLEGYALHEYFIDIPVFWMQGIALLYVSMLLLQYFLIKKKNYFLLIFLGILALWLISFLTMMSGDLSRYGEVKWADHLPIGEMLIYNINNSIFNLCIPLSIIVAKKYYEFQINKLKIMDAQKELELKVLRAHYDPHFLYNSLNTIDAMVDYSSKEEIKQYISNLAGLYRHLIKTKEEDVMPLQVEIQLAQNYVYLIKTRFQNDYDFSFELNDFSENVYLPTGAVLAVIENVVKHNKPSPQQQITVRIYLKENRLCIENTKSNNTVLQKESLGTGLQNLSKQYQLLHDENIEIINLKDQFTIKLPLLKLIN